MGKLTRCLGAAALIALIAIIKTESALAVPFDIDCGGQADIDTAAPTLVVCGVGVLGEISDLTVALEIDDPGGFPYVADLEITLTDDSTGISVVLYSGSLVAAPQAYMDATFDDSAAALAPTVTNAIPSGWPSGSPARLSSKPRLGSNPIPWGQPPSESPPTHSIRVGHSDCGRTAP